MALPLIPPHGGFNFSVQFDLEDLLIHVQSNGSHNISISSLHTHQALEVQLPLSGQYCIEFDGGSLELTAPEDLCLIPAGLIHRSSPGLQPARQFSLFLFWQRKPRQSRPSLLAQTLACLPKDVPLRLHGEEQLRAAMLAVCQEASMPGLFSESLLRVLLQQFCLLLLRHCGQSASIPSPTSAVRDAESAQYHKIEQFMQRNFATGITQEDLARELCVSRRQISRIMPRLYEGATFQKKLDEIRMYHALQHLLLTDTPVEDIAPLVGYTSISGFFVAFKRTFGISPAAYRRAYRKAPPTT